MISKAIGGFEVVAYKVGNLFCPVIIKVVSPVIRIRFPVNTHLLYVFWHVEIQIINSEFFGEGGKIVMSRHAPVISARRADKDRSYPFTFAICNHLFEIEKIDLWNPLLSER